EDQLTLAARLQQAGDHTGLIGEWGLGAKPWEQGVDEFAGFLNEQEAKNYYSEFMWRFAPKGGVDENTGQLKDFEDKEELHGNVGGQKGQYIPDLLMYAAEHFAKNNRPDFANKYRPFFLLVNLPAPQSVTTGKDDFPVPTDAPFTDEKW